MGPLGASTGTISEASTEEAGAPSREPAARLHSADTLAPGDHLAPHSLELSLAHGCRCRLLAVHGTGSDECSQLEE